jgi:uncharacterized protein YndB with AHSA1/START domain
MQTDFKSTYQTTINAPVEMVWEGLTNPALVQLYFYGADQQTDWKVGSTITWTGVFEGNPYLDKGVVLEYKENEKLIYSYLSSWSGREDTPENHLFVSYEVKPVDEGTELTIIQSNYDEERAEHSKENWKVVIEGLKKVVEPG